MIRLIPKWDKSETFLDKFSVHIKIDQIGPKMGHIIWNYFLKISFENILATFVDFGTNLTEFVSNSEIRGAEPQLQCVDKLDH